MNTDAPVGVLDGYKVLDFTQYVAGPTVTLMMAEMGAEIIKVELAPGGDKTRLAPMQVNGRSGYYVQHNRGKKSLCVDPKSPEGLAILKALVAKVDVVVENFAPGVIGRMGLGWETVKSINPRAIMCSVSAFGQTGRSRASPASTLWAPPTPGLPAWEASPTAPPYVVMAAIGDVSTGAHAMGAIACALLYRERSGRGQYLDLSLLDTYFHYHEASVQIHSLSRGAYKPMRSGCRTFISRRSEYSKRKRATSSSCVRWIISSRFCATRWAGRSWRRTRATSTTSRGWKTARRWWMRSKAGSLRCRAMRPRWPRCRSIGCRARQCCSVDEAINHPHLRERGTIRKVHDRLLGEFELPGFALRFSDFPAQLDLEAPFLGEHNAEVLGDYLGYTAEQVADLERRGVIRHEQH